MLVVQIRKQFKFEAAHVLPHHTGKCSRLHGHSYRLDVTLEGDLQPEGPGRGMIVDFDVLSHGVKTGVIEELDHRSLNEVIPNPTCENIVRWIWHRLAPEFPQLAELVLWETATSSALLRRGDAQTASPYAADDDAAAR
ncbi:MAG: 6-carboxytetrahydropterin synthase QueD [Candidatus Velthaea sp.]